MRLLTRSTYGKTAVAPMRTLGREGVSHGSTGDDETPFLPLLPRRSASMKQERLVVRPCVMSCLDAASTRAQTHNDADDALLLRLLSLLLY